MDKYETYVEAAKAAYKENNLIKAARLYETAFVEEVRIDDLLHLGAIYLDLKKYNSALKIFEDVISVQPNNFLAYYGLASSYNDLGRAEDAIINFKKVLMLNPEYADAYFGIALILDYQDNDECEKYYLKTIEYDPNHYWANTNLGPFYDKKENYELALKHTKIAFDIDPNGSLVAFNLGVIYSKLKDFDESLKYYKIELEKDNPHITTYLNLGLLYKDIFKDFDLAKQTYLEGISKDKDNSDIWYNLGCLYVALDDLENAYNCLLYANLKDFKLRDFMKEDPELEEFRKTLEYKKLIETIKG